MERRGSMSLDDLAAVPWWFGVLLGVVGYLLIVFGAPFLAAGNPILEGAAQAATRFVAPLWLLFCLLGAGLSAVNTWHARRLYDKRRSSSSLASLSWQAFEQLVGEHFRRRGYHVAEKGGSRPDGGVDLIVTRDGERYVVQCKHWKARQVGVSVVRELVGSITQSGAVGGFLVASGSVTAPALALARDAGIEVVDGTRLRAELDETSAAGDVGRAESEQPRRQAPACPMCNRPMVVRTARRGHRAGQQFWGCSGYPACRGTLTR